MAVRVKICCIENTEEAALAVTHGANLLGLVAEMPSGPGPIPDSHIQDIAATVPPGVTATLLTSRDSPDSIVRHVKYCGVQAVQIVRHVRPSVLQILRHHLPSTRILQVVHVSDENSLVLAKEYARYADAILLDSGKPTDNPDQPETLGGTGDTHDWTISKRIVDECPVPVFLAGGLTPDNITEALAWVRPWGVDLCSGIRTDGKLDPAKLAAFMKAVRAFELQEMP